MTNKEVAVKDVSDEKCVEYFEELHTDEGHQETHNTKKQSQIRTKLEEIKAAKRNIKNWAIPNEDDIYNIQLLFKEITFYLIRN